MSKVYILFFLVLTSMHVVATNYYVAASGSDSNNGLSVENPFQTIPKAINMAVAGDFIFVRGGIYPISTTISITKSGNASARYSLMAYADERPVLDFSTTAFGKRGVNLSGSYWHIKGFDMIKAGDNGMIISGGGNNIIEFCAFIGNNDTGLQLGGGTHDNQIINCDSYYNADPTDYADADGFACKMDVGSNNSFYGCRAWLNVDDGWDGYLRGTDNVSTTLENCWTWMNGYFKDGIDAGAGANGNGFKMGGSDDKLLKHDFTLKNCVAFDNKAKGFDQNNNKGSMILYNCSAYRNKGNNYSVSTPLPAGKILEVKNCLSADNKVSLGNFAIQATNSWLAPFSVSPDDFLSLDTLGSLPDVNFLHLVEGSDLIDNGTNIGLPFKGILPDLGAFESDFSTGFKTNTIFENEFKAGFRNDDLFIVMNKPINESIQCSLIRLNGQVSLAFKIEETGKTYEINCNQLPQGVYILRLSSVNHKLKPQKLVKLN